MGRGRSPAEHKFEYQEPLRGNLQKSTIKYLQNVIRVSGHDDLVTLEILDQEAVRIREGKVRKKARELAGEDIRDILRILTASKKDKLAKEKRGQARTTTTRGRKKAALVFCRARSDTCRA